MNTKSKKNLDDVVGRLKKIPYFVALSLAQSGIYYFDNCIATASAFFEQKLHMDPTIIKVIFDGIIPICLIMLQPIFGLISDLLERRIRRLIIVGSIFLFISMIILGFCDQIGYSLGDEYFEESSGNGNSNQTVGRTFGFIFLIFSYIAYSLIQSPCRVLINDFFEKKNTFPRNEDYRETADFVASMFSGISAFGFYLITYFVTSLTYYYQIIYVSSSVVMAVFCFITCLVTFIKEEGRRNKKTKGCCGEVFESLFKNTNKNGNAKKIFKELILLYCMELIGMMAFEGIRIKVCDFFSKNFYHATSDDDSYNDGISMGMIGMMVMSVFQTISSFVLSLMPKNKKKCWIISFIISTVASFVMIICDVISKNYSIPPWWLLTISYICMACFGMIGCCAYSIFFSLVGQLLEKDLNYGFYLSQLISIIHLARGFMNLLNYLLLISIDSLVVVFYACGVLSVITVVSSIFIFDQIKIGVETKFKVKVVI